MKKITGIGLKLSWLHTRFLILFVLGVLLPLFNANAQTGTIQIGSGSATSTGGTTIPVTNYDYSYSQQIVTAAEYANGEGIPGQITKIRYYVTDIGTLSVWNNWTVYLGNTTKTSFTSTTDWVPVASLTQVFSGTITATNNNWFEITFSQPFNYTGGNLIVAVDENAVGWTLSPTFQMYTSTSNSGILYRADGTDPNPSSPPTATSRQSTLPQLQFVGNVVSCLRPTNVNVSAITSNGATINWTASTSLPSSGYMYEVRTDTNPGTAGAVLTGSVGAGIVTAPIVGLQPNTPYNVYVKSDCGSGNTSMWTPITTFRTLCESVSTFPWTENFNAVTTPNLPTCLSQINANNDADFWQTYTDYGVASSKAVGLYTDYNAGSNNDYLILPKFALTGNQRMKFTVRARSASEPNDYRVVLSTTGNAAANFTTVLKPLTVVSNTTHQEISWIDLSAYTGEVFIAIHVPQGGLDGYYIYFDDFLIQNIPSCLIPENVQIAPATITKNAARISWTAPTTAPGNGYEYEIRTSGIPSSGATGLVQQGVTVAGVLSKDITGLTPSTTYSLYVRSVCAADNLSAWTIVKTFKTLCDYPDFISKTVGTICGIGTASISANFTNNNNIKWYAEQTGGNSLHTGTSFTTPELNTSTSFWVSASSDGLTEGAGAKPAPASSATGSSFSNWGIVFNVSQDIVLKSTDVYSSSNGTLDVKILNPAGTEIFSTGNVNVINGGTTTANVIPLNVTLSAGVGYKILIKNYSGVNLIRESSGLAFPYIEANGTLTATASEWGGTTTGSYYYFYNLKYEVSCSSPRIEVPVTVTEAPGLILSADEITICQGNDSELITVMSGLADYDTFTWTPETGVSGNEIDGWLINAQSSGMYTLRASQSNGSLCKADVELNVLVTQIGYEPLEEEYIVCKDVIQELSVGADEIDINDLSGLQLYNFSFDQVPLQGFTHNNLTGTTSVALNTSVFTEGTGSVRFSHVTSSTGNLTQNSSVDASGGYGVKVEFDHIALLESSSYDWDYGYLQYSLDGGNTWVSFGQSQYLGEADTSTTTPINYVRFGKNSYTDWNALTSTSTPVNSLWKHETFFLQKGDLDLSNFKIRFSLKSDGSTNWNGWYLDNLKISKVSLPTTVWTGQGLFVDADATQAYAGENTQTVYFKHNLEGEYPVSATISNAVTNCSATTTTIVKVPLVILPVIENQVYCEPKGVEDLIFDRTDGYVYAWYASATSVATISTINTSGTYYLQVTSNVGECKSSRVPVEIIIAQNLNPTVNPSYTFCDQATFENIQVGTQYGAAVQWFATADSTTVLPANTQLSTTTYYVALAINDCISERKPVSVTILQTPAPITTQEFTVCFNTPLSQLSLGATNIKWYYSQTSSTALGVSAIAQSNTYYVTTFNGICESARIPVVVTVVQQLQMPTAATQNFCGSGTVSQLTATGAVSGAEYVWYNSATSTTPLQPGAALQNGTYYVSQKLTNCESPRRPVTVKVTNLTAPTATSFEFCGSATVADLSMPVISGITYNWYLPNQTTPLAATANLVTGNYLVSKAQNGCESTKTIVQVTIKPRPASPTGSLTQNFIDSAMISDLVMDQSNVIWYVTYEDALNGNNPLQTNMPIEDDHIYYGVLIGSNGCASLPTAVTATITLGVKDLDLASLKYYPNPVDSELTISYKEQIKLIEIYDLLGKQIKVQKFDSNDIRVNVSGLSSGTYMFRVQTNTGSQFIKIIKK